MYCTAADIEAMLVSRQWAQTPGIFPSIEGDSVWYLPPYLVFQSQTARRLIVCDELFFQDL